MDTFIEKIVAKKKGVKDHLITIGVVLAVLIAIPVIFNIPVIGNMGLLVSAVVIYLAYRIITSRNIEFEYIVTNGDLDIDKIVSQRKRKRIFSASCKDFDIVARVKSNSFSPRVQSIKNRIEAVSSVDSDNAYFATLNYKGEPTVVFFEPNEKMLENFRLFIPRKILTK